MRILALTHGDGSNRTFEKLVDSLVQFGFDVKIIGWDRLRSYKRSGGSKHVPVTYLLRGGGYRNILLPFFWYPLWIARAIVFLLFNRSDVVWAANFEAAFPAAVSSIVTGVPFIYYIHDNLCLTYNIPFVTKTLFRLLDGWTIKRASLVFVPDECRIEPQAEKYRNKVVVLPNTPRAKLAEELDCEPSGHELFDVLALGTLWRSRGIEMLVDAVKRIPNCRVLMAGSAPEPDVQEAIAACAQITYLGRVDHARALCLYRQVHAVFAFYDPRIPVNVFASPTKLYEAMLMGKAVIMNSEVRLSEKVQDWQIGYSCAYDDIDALVRILQRIVGTPTEADEMGKRARVLFEQNYAWELLVPRLEEAIRTRFAEGGIGGV